MTDQPNPHEPLASEKITNGRKIFFVDLKENQRGRMYKITEDVGGRRDTIIVPSEAVTDLIECLSRLQAYEKTLR